MTYIGDFPPCTHKFINSNGVVLCERCGAYSAATRTTTYGTSTGA